MKYFFLCVLVLLAASVAGCQPQPSLSTTVATPQGDAAAVVQQQGKSNVRTIEIADLLDALQMEIWKAPINQNGDEAIRKVSLCSKQKGGEPTTVLTIDLAKDATSPGSLMVYLQYVAGRRYKVGLVYHSEDGRHHATSDTIDDPLAQAAGIVSALGTSVGRTGIIVLKSTRFDIDGLDAGGGTDAAGIYLKNE